MQNNNKTTDNMNTNPSTITASSKDIAAFKATVINLASRIADCNKGFTSLREDGTRNQLMIERHIGEQDIEFLSRLAMHLTVLESEVAKGEAIKATDNELKDITRVPAAKDAPFEPKHKVAKMLLNLARKVG